MIIGSKRHRRRGLGATTAAIGAGTPWWCGSVFTQNVAAAWMPTDKIMSTCYPTLPAPVPPVAPSTPQQMTGADAWTPDQAIQATNALQQQQTAGFFQNFSTWGAGVDANLTGGDGGSQPSNSLCSLIFGTSIAGQIGQALCPLVMIVGGVAVVALISFIFIEKH